MENALTFIDFAGHTVVQQLQDDKEHDLQHNPHDEDDEESVSELPIQGGYITW